jgi:hypothetical protein
VDDWGRPTPAGSDEQLDSAGAILAEPGAARFAGIAAFSSLLLQQAGFGTNLEAGTLVHRILDAAFHRPQHCDPPALDQEREAGS